MGTRLGTHCGPAADLAVAATAGTANNATPNNSAASAAADHIATSVTAENADSTNADAHSHTNAGTDADSNADTDAHSHTNADTDAHSHADMWWWPRPRSKGNCRRRCNRHRDRRHRHGLHRDNGPLADGDLADRHHAHGHDTDGHHADLRACAGPTCPSYKSITRRSSGGMFVLGGNISVSRSFSLPFIANRFGGGDAALDRGAAMVNVARGHAFPPLSFATGGCNSLGGRCTINPATGNLLLQASPPAGRRLLHPTGVGPQQYECLNLLRDR